MKRSGRPITLSDDVHKGIVAGFANRLPLSVIGGHVARHPDTIGDWLRRGADAAAVEDTGDAIADESEAPFLALYRECTRARATAEATALDRIREAGMGVDGDWRALVAWLELTAPERYSRAAQVRKALRATARVLDIEGASEGLDAATVDGILDAAREAEKQREREYRELNSANGTAPARG